MPHSRSGLRLGLVVVVMAVLTLTGCSKDVSQDKVEKEITRVYEKKGSTIEDVSCDGELKGEKGATQTCTATIDGVDTDLIATVDEVDDDNTVRFTVGTKEEVSQTPSETPSESSSSTPDETPSE